MRSRPRVSLSLVIVGSGASASGIATCLTRRCLGRKPTVLDSGADNDFNKGKLRGYGPRPGDELAFAVAVGESGISEARADRQHAPAFHVLHEGDLGEALHDAVVMHDDGRVVLADSWDGFD